jgi:hypothetical protein
VEGRGLTGAAEAAGISKQTAWRRLQTDEVRELVAEVEAERRTSLMSWARSIRSLGDLVTDAVVAVLDDSPTPNSVLRLAGVVLPEVRHLAETVELADRLEALEARLGAPDQSRSLGAVLALDPARLGVSDVVQ